MEVLDNFLTGIADSLRKVTATTNLIPAQDFSPTIETLGLNGAQLQTKTVNIISSGTTIVSPDEGYDGMTRVTVNANVSSDPTFEFFGANSTGTSTVTLSKNFTIPSGKSKAWIIAIVNTQGSSDWSCTISSGSGTVTEGLYYDATNSYNNSQAVNHKVKIYDITTDGNGCTAALVLGGGANRFLFAVGIY